MPLPNETYQQHPRRALMELCVRLEGEKAEALKDWLKWKDDPLMQDVATHYNRRVGALHEVVEWLNLQISTR